MGDICYHTCLTDGGAPYVQSVAPFRSAKDSYLGSGYYVWERYLSHAKWWGMTHIAKRQKRPYFVVEMEIEYTRKSPPLLDLEQPDHRDHLRDLIRDAEELGYGETPKVLGKFIEWLKKSDKEEPGLFPYRVIRCRDNRSRNTAQAEAIRFVDQSEAFIDLMPRIMICYDSELDVSLSRKKVVYRHVLS